MIETIRLEPTSERSKRARKLALNIYIYLCGIVFSYGLVNMYLGLYYSMINTFSLTLFLMLGAYLFIRKGRYFLGNFITFTSLTIHLAIYIYLEGIMSGHHLYYLTMIFGIPLLVHRGNNFKKQSIFCYSVITFVIFTTAIVSPLYSETYELSTTQTHAKLAVNCVISFFFISMFSFLTTLFAKSYIKKIIRQKKNAELEKDTRTRVISNLSHELRTQINSINGITQLILDKKNLDETGKEYAQILNYCNNNMLFLVNDLLDIHKIESGKFELTLTPKIIKDVLSKTTLPFVNKAQEKGIKLINDIDQKLNTLVVNIDHARLTQVIHNLLSNALKFTSQGQILFSAKLKSETLNQATIVFKVADTGIGISKDNYNKIFDSFLQIKTKPIYGGTGLGLAISKTIIEKMNSEIKVESIIDEGSIFSFTLTLDKVIGESTIFQETQNNLSFNLDNNTILVVEDNAVSMLYANSLLNKHNAKTYQAVDGLDAIEKVKLHDDIDLVLLDLEMPKMNGFDAITHIKEMRPDLPVIAFTANIPDQNMLTNLKELNFDDIIPKPFKKEDLFPVLKKYLKYGLSKSSA